VSVKLVNEGNCVVYVNLGGNANAYETEEKGSDNNQPLFGGSESPSEGDSLQILTSPIALKLLELCYSGVRDLPLARQTNLPALEELNFDSCPIGDWAILHLVDNSVVPNLTSLHRLGGYEPNRPWNGSFGKIQEIATFVSILLQYYEWWTVVKSETMGCGIYKI
jgi:hypothetical protein